MCSRLSRLPVMEQTYDAIVVGARCAGSATALLLARRGHRVLVVDRDPFPSDPATPSANLVPEALRHLRDWGLYERVAGTGAPPIRQLVTHAGGVDLVSDCPELDGIDHCLCVRRSVLDMVLAQAAIEAGAVVRFGTEVTALRWAGGQVVGIEAADRHGHVITARAPVVIGADGRCSFVAGAVGASVREQARARSAVTFTYYIGLGVEQAERWQGEAGQLFFLPSHFGETWVVHVSDGGQPLGDPESHLATFPDATERLAAGRRVAPLSSVADLGRFRRDAAGPGWLLVGDAAAAGATHANGVHDAFAHASLVADALDRGVEIDERLLDRQLVTCLGA